MSVTRKSYEHLCRGLHSVNNRLAAPIVLSLSVTVLSDIVGTLSLFRHLGLVLSNVVTGTSRLYRNEEAYKCTKYKLLSNFIDDMYRHG